MSATRRRGARTHRSAAAGGREGPALNWPGDWPGDPETVTAADIDFRAVARVLANICRHGGRIAAYHSLAGHAVLVSAEIEALDGLGAEDRRALALHALLADAPAAWLGDRSGGRPGGRSGPGTAESQRAADRANRLAARIEGAMREAAGLDPALADDHRELLRFVARMAAAAERRDLAVAGDAGPGVAFPPLKRRVRPLEPDRAAALWLERFEALARPPGNAGAGAPERIETDHDRETGDVAHLPEKEQEDTQAARVDRAGERDAA